MSSLWPLLFPSVPDPWVLVPLTGKPSGGRIGKRRAGRREGFSCDPTLGE